MKTKLSKKTKTICSGILILAAVGFLIFLELNQTRYAYLISVLERSVIYAVVAVSMNLLNGFTGLFSLGQAGFMAIGAYTVAIFTIPAAARSGVYYISGINPVIAGIEIPFIAALILGGLFAALVAFLIGIPVLRLKSDYLAIATLGFAEIIRALIASPQMDTVTNGSYGLKKIPSFPTLFVPFGIAALCIAIMVLLIKSSYGRAFKAIRDDEIAAEAMGINLFRHKQLAFVISSFFTGVGGGLLAVFMRSIDSGAFKIAITYDILLIVVLGGMGSVTGSVIAAFLVTTSREFLRFFDNPLTIGTWEVPLFRSGFRMVIFSLLLMAVVLFYNKGIMGTREFSWDGIAGSLQRIGKIFKKKKRGAPND